MLMNKLRQSKKHLNIDQDNNLFSNLTSYKVRLNVLWYGEYFTQGDLTSLLYSSDFLHHRNRTLRLNTTM